MSQTTFLKSTFIVTVATLFSKLLGSFFRIPLQNIAGDEVLGIFTLVYPIYMMTLILSVAGIPLAISKLISEARATGHEANIRKVYQTSSLLGVLFGFVSFAFIALFATPISQLLGGTETKPALVLVSTGLLFAPYMAVYRGYFQGFNDMNPTAYSQVLEQFVRAAFILGTAYVLTSWEFSDEWIAGGVMVGSLAGVIASLLFLRHIYTKSSYKITVKEPFSFTDFKGWSKTILRISIPIAIGTVMMALLNVVDSFTIPFSLRHYSGMEGTISYQYGIYGRGLSLVQIATIFATSMILPLVPLLTSKKKANEGNEMRSLIELTHRLTHLISWPAAIGLMALTIPLNISLFTNNEGSLVIAILGFSSVFTSLAIVGTGVLQGIDAARLAAYIILIGVLLKTGLNLWLVQWFGIDGAGLSTLLVYVSIVFINTMFIYRHCSFKVLELSHLKALLSSLLMGVLIGMPTLAFSMNEWSRGAAFLYSLAAIGIGAGIYVAALFIFKAIDRETVQRIPYIRQFLKHRK